MPPTRRPAIGQHAYLGMGLLLLVALSSNEDIINGAGARRLSLVEERPPGFVLQEEIGTHVVTIMVGEGQYAECRSPDNNILIQAGNNHTFDCRGRPQ